MRIFKYILLLLIFLPCAAGAHPHLFIESSVRVVFDNEGMTGVQMRWEFDEMFSSTVINDYDSNKDGFLSTVEVEAIRKGAFSNLKDYNYFTFITIGSKAFEVKYVKNFQATIKEHKLRYSFFVPCHVKAVPETKNATIAVYDESFFADVLVIDCSCDHSAAPGAVSSTVTTRESADKSFNYGQIAPMEIVLSFKK